MTIGSEVSSRQKSIDDRTLISTFVDSFVHKRAVMISNANLRTEPALGSIQLLARQEGLVSTAKMDDVPLRAWVRQTSRYWNLINQRLIARNFFPMLDLHKQNCYLYEHYPVPPGYTVHCSTAKELWRVCWSREFRSRSGLPMDLLLLSRGPCGAKQTWYPIRGMDCRQGALYIKMLGGEAQVDLDDLLVWLRQGGGEAGNGVWPSVAPGFKGLLSVN